MEGDIDRLLIESVLAGASEALDDIALELVALRDGWAAIPAQPSTLQWLDDLIAKAGWWSGRLAAVGNTQ